MPRKGARRVAAATDHRTDHRLRFWVLNRPAISRGPPWRLNNRLANPLSPVRVRVPPPSSRVPIPREGVWSARGHSWVSVSERERTIGRTIGRSRTPSSTCPTRQDPRPGRRDPRRAGAACSWSGRRSSANSGALWLTGKGPVEARPDGSKWTSRDTLAVEVMRLDVLIAVPLRSSPFETVVAGKRRERGRSGAHCERNLPPVHAW